MLIAAETAPRRVRGPVRDAERALTPDLARGAMLLLIGLANAAGVALGGPGVVADPHGIDRLLNLLLDTFVHGRAYPVFAIMFGYGLVQLAARQSEAGATPRAVRSLLLRRHMWLVAFGFGHAALLYFGDFLGAYGLIGMVATAVLLGRGERVQRVVLWLWAVTALEVLVLAAISAIQMARGAEAAASQPMTAVASLVAPTYIASVRARLTEWPAHTATVLPAIVIVWLGMWAADRRLLEHPSAHRPLLRRVAAIGLGIAFVGGLPMGLASAGLLPASSSARSTMFLLHQVSGMFGGPGYIALTGLVTDRLSRRPGAARAPGVIDAIAALGRRSLSGYLFQSVAWVWLLSPYSLDLGRRFDSALLTALLTALAVWIVSVMAAERLQRFGYRGPAETMLRRLVYGNVAPDRLTS